jgi:hypothetical protein
MVMQEEVKLPAKETAEAWAKETYKVLTDLWDAGLSDAANKKGWLWEDFWKGGNTLDSVINYYSVLKLKKEYKYIEDSYNYLFSKLPYGTGHWRDDYGWWGNAFVNAFKYIDSDEAASGLKNDCKAAAKQCWEWLYESAKDNKTYTSTCNRSLFGEGYAAWNGGSAEAYDKENGKCRKNPGGTYSYNSVPNSVTNLGFWALSNGIQEFLDSDSKYLDSMRDSFDWMYTYHKSSPSLLLNKAELIFETPNPWAHRDANFNPNDPRGWCVDPQRAWTADQGVFIYSAIKTLKKEANQNTARAKELTYLIKTILWSLVMKRVISDNFVLHEFPTDPEKMQDNNASNFNDNYCTGPGVLMRYLGYSYPMISGFDPNFSTQTKKLIVTTAAKAWQCRDAKGIIRCWHEADIKKTKYWRFYKLDSPAKNLWDFAFQTAALDLFVAQLRLY